MPVPRRRRRARSLAFLVFVAGGGLLVAARKAPVASTTVLPRLVRTTVRDATWPSTRPATRRRRDDRPGSVASVRIVSTDVGGGAVSTRTAGSIVAVTVSSTPGWNRPPRATQNSDGGSSSALLRLSPGRGRTSASAPWRNLSSISCVLRNALRTRPSSWWALRVRGPGGDQIAQLHPGLRAPPVEHPLLVDQLGAGGRLVHAPAQAPQVQVHCGPGQAPPTSPRWGPRKTPRRRRAAAGRWPAGRPPGCRRAGAASDEALARGQCHGVRPIARVRLHEEVMDDVLHRSHRVAHRIGDLAGVRTPRQRAQHFQLPLREWVGPSRPTAGRPVEQAGHHLGR